MVVLHFVTIATWVYVVLAFVAIGFAIHAVRSSSKFTRKLQSIIYASERKRQRDIFASEKKRQDAWFQMLSEFQGKWNEDLDEMQAKWIVLLATSWENTLRIATRMESVVREEPPEDVA